MAVNPVVAISVEPSAPEPVALTPARRVELAEMANESPELAALFAFPTPPETPIESESATLLFEAVWARAGRPIESEAASGDVFSDLSESGSEGSGRAPRGAEALGRGVKNVETAAKLDIATLLSSVARVAPAARETAAVLADLGPAAGRAPDGSISDSPPAPQDAEAQSTPSPRPHASKTLVAPADTALQQPVTEEAPPVVNRSSTPSATQESPAPMNSSPVAPASQEPPSRASAPPSSNPPPQGSVPPGSAENMQSASQPTPGPKGEVAFSAQLRPASSQPDRPATASEPQAPARQGGEPLTEKIQAPAAPESAMDSGADGATGRDAGPFETAAGRPAAAQPARSSFAPPRAYSAPPAAAVDPMAAEGEAAARPAGRIELQLRGENNSTANVLFAERGGQVQVTVRAPDPSAVQALRSELHQLSAGLESQGLQVRVATPPSTAATRDAEAGAEDGSTREEPKTGEQDQEQRRHPRHRRPQEDFELFDELV